MADNKFRQFPETILFPGIDVQRLLKKTPNKVQKHYYDVTFARFNLIFAHVGECFRGSHRRCSVKKGVLRNFAKFTGKHLCQCLFFNKVAG